MRRIAVLLLLTKSLPEIRRFDSPYLGRLFTPRHVNAVENTVGAGIPWAADNDAFGGFKPGPFLKMLGTLAGTPGCKFVTAPDVVADWASTLVLWDIYRPVIHDCDLPAAIVLQDGADHIPSGADAVFIGGSTEWKLSPEAEALARMAKELGRWLHMGRVNSIRRLRRAQDWGCDSVDGSSWARFTDTWVPRAVTVLSHEQRELVL
jgi:hypothetical protein